MDKLKLEPTSALAMQWIKNALPDEIVQKFIDYLDLSSGEELFQLCNTVCDWYSEVIVNRKYFISEYIKTELSKSENENLLINLGAGKSPLALQILEQHSEKIDHVLEIDITGMEIKKELYDKHFPQYSKKIKCISADITSSIMLSSINKLLHEYYNDHQCIIVLEGISYYLSYEDIKNIVKSLRSKNRNNLIIFEYLLPSENVTKERRHIPENVFNTIKNYAGLKNITIFEAGKLNLLFSEFEGQILHSSNLHEIEKLRLGVNKYFKSADDGWIEFAVWNL